jgi:phosphoglucomutase/phosphomannomutase
MQHGCHVEDLLNVHMEGSEGMSKMKTLMAAFRAKPPKSLGSIAVTTVRDYEQLTRTHVDGPVEKLDAPKGNMVVLDLADEGNYVAVRPSGTEPKVKFYFFSYLPPSESKDLASAKARLNERLALYRRDIEAYTKSVVG